MKKGKKIVSQKLKDILNSVQSKMLMNRAMKINWQYYIALWMADLFNRKPAPAYNVDGEFIGTDLDFHTFIATLVYRGAMINLPKEYESMRETVLKEGQMLSSKTGRHGKCMGLSSNKNVWSFGIRILDLNVMMSEDAGDPRVFNVMDIDGKWYPGWKVIEFMPNMKENDFLNDFDLVSDDKIVLDHFISKWRRYSIYSEAYYLTKMAIVRLDDEAKFLAGMMKLMLDSGITYPEEAAPKKWPEQTKVGNTKSIQVESVTFEADIPPLEGEYPEMEMNQENLVEATKRRKWLLYTVKPKLQYAIRGNEFANFKYTDRDGDNEFPHWMQNVEWESGYKKPATFVVKTAFIKKFIKDETITRNLTLMKDRSYKENEINQFYSEYSNLDKRFGGTGDVPEELRKKVKATKGRTELDRIVFTQPEAFKYGVSLIRKTFIKTETVNINYGES